MVLCFYNQTSNLSLKGCAHLYKSIKNNNKSILLQIKAKWEDNLNDTISFDQVKTCLIVRNKTTECTYLRYIQFKILNNKLVTQSPAYTSTCNALLSLNHSTLEGSNVEKWVRNDIQPYYKMSDWDKVFAIPSHPS